MADKKRILVVDDEPQITRVLRTALTGSGYDVRTADDGHSGLRVAREWQPDLVITDISMPNMNGIQAIDHLRDRFPHVPVVVLTGYPDVHMAVSCLRDGVVDYLVKPVDSKQLLAAVSRAMVERELAWR